MVNSITEKVNGRPQNTLRSVASGIMNVLQSTVDRNVEGAMTALKRLDKYQESTAGPTSGIRRFRRQFRTSRIGITAKMMLSETIPESLSEAESRLNLANLLSDVHWTIRHVDVDGWLALKLNFALLLEDGGDAQVADIRRVAEVLERHWSDTSKWKI